jgi:hypothetical protein
MDFMLKTSGFVKANSNSNVIYAYYYFTDISEINVVGSLLGLNLLEVITIFRAYRCKGNASVLISKQSVIIPMCVVLSTAILATGTSFLFEDKQQNNMRSCGFCTLFGITFEMLFYHAIEVIPTVIVYIAFVLYAFWRCRKSHLNTRQNRVTRGKRVKNIRISAQIYLVTFFSAWIPFIVFKVSCLNTKDESQYWLYQQMSLCAELALFLSKPLAGGMLLKKNRLQIKVFIIRATKSTLPSLYSILNKLNNCNG